MLALTAYEDNIDPATGQDVRLSTNPALAEFWTTMTPTRDYAHQALAIAQKNAEKDDHPQTLRHVIGLRPGWEEALAASRESASADHQGDQPEPEEGAPEVPGPGYEHED